ncbi:MAG: hypothetical protein IPG04_05465 [Polyangiaceae bacterium]|nr:hypothetical protein [Polyangiaceae bacterium]
MHVVTVNDHLAAPRLQWMGRCYGFLGLSTGVVVNQQNDAEKRVAYRSDITYGQNNEFGLRLPARQHEVLGARVPAAPAPATRSSTSPTPSLIDEARTPRIISGRGDARATSTGHQG